MRPYKLHFVCRGNVYRSRLAEAYVRSLSRPDISVSSSGIRATVDNPGVAFASYARAAAKQDGILPYVTATKTQTTDEILAQPDVIVFMNQDVYDDAVKEYAVTTDKCFVWDVADLGPQLHAAHLPDTDTNDDTLAAQTFLFIQKHVDDLLQDLFKTSWADILDKNGDELGYRFPVSIADDRGLWRRGCHALITTADGRFIIQKRSKDIVFAPGAIEVSLGGGVDAGEKPEEAVLREIREELGIHVKPDQLRLIDVRKWSSYHPRYHKYSRCFIYAYHVALPETHPIMHRQESEVSAIQIIGRRRLHLLLRLGHLRSIGAIGSGIGYTRQMVKLAETNLK